MRTSMLGGISLLALSASLATAAAAPITFEFTGSSQAYTVPVTGVYDLLAFGASGAAIRAPGGLGAQVGGDFVLNAGDVLQIAVGSAGIRFGGGGGGSFVVGPGNTPLVIAGGGGGGSFITGGAGQTGTAGGAGTNNGAAGGTSGGGGSGGGGGNGAGGGGGFNGPGTSGDGTTGRGGDGYPSLLGGIGEDGSSGGFGGGGGGGRLSGGGGGGFNGGGGGSSLQVGGGGGGGSFNGGINQVFVAGVNSGNGSVVITPPDELTPVPEAASLALLGTGLVGLLALRRRR